MNRILWACDAIWDCKWLWSLTKYGMVLLFKWNWHDMHVTVMLKTFFSPSVLKRPCKTPWLHPFFILCLHFDTFRCYTTICSCFKTKEPIKNYFWPSEVIFFIWTYYTFIFCKLHFYPNRNDLFINMIKTTDVGSSSLPHFSSELSPRNKGYLLCTGIQLPNNIL